MSARRTGIGRSVNTLPDPVKLAKLAEGYGKAVVFERHSAHSKSTINMMLAEGRRILAERKAANGKAA